MHVFSNALRAIRVGARDITALMLKTSRSLSLRLLSQCFIPMRLLLGSHFSPSLSLSTRLSPLRLLSSRFSPPCLLLPLLLLYLFNTTSAVALQIDDPAHTLNDHTNSHFLPNRTGIVQLFEWKFADIAKECEEFLGPRGYAGVQVSPVTEHLVVRSDSTSPQHPWWERYQPLSYQIASRSGNEADFEQMSRTCNAAGVRVYVDVVLNHLAGAYDEETASGQRLLEGYASSTANASSYDFPAFPFTRNQFHKPCELDNYMDADVVRNCALSGWPDLNHDSLDVRGNLTELLNRLVDLGVAGFRVDSAKYIWPTDIKLLFNDVKDLNSEEFGFPENARPFVYQDVVDLGIDSISKTEYSSYGLVTDYLYAAELANIINGKAPLSSLINWGPAMGFLPHQQALVFVDSHDAQRESTLLGANKLLSYKQPRKYIMATAFMLAHPYGRVKRIMSSYYFAAEQPEQGPPMEEGAGEETDTEAGAEEDGGEVAGAADAAEDDDAAATAEAADGTDGAAEGDDGGEDAAVEAEAAEGKEAENEEAEGETADVEAAEGEAAEDADAAADADPPTQDAPQAQHIRSPTFDAATGHCERESGWVCEHRWPPIVNMIELVNTLDELEDGVMNFQTDGPNHIAFCRGVKAFFAFNNDAHTPYDAEVVTCLPSGIYCDVISGGRATDATGCDGKRVVVDAEGKARILLPAVFKAGEAGTTTLGSDYDDADVEANDAYGLALGEDREFGVLAIYEGSRLGDEVKSGEEIEDGGGKADVPANEDGEKETETEAVAEDDAEDEEDVGDGEKADDAEKPEDEGKTEDAEDTEDKDAEKEDVSTEKVEGEAIKTEKSAKLEEAATDASVENADEADGAAETEGGGEEKDEVEGEAGSEDAEPPADEPASPEAGEQPTAADGAPADEGTEDAAPDVDDKADEVAVDEPAEEADSPAVDGETKVPNEETAVGEDISETTKNKLDETGNGVTDAANKAEGNAIGELGTGIKTIAEGIANKTNRVIAKAGFNANDAARMTKSIPLCSLTILISTILANFYST